MAKKLTNISGGTTFLSFQTDGAGNTKQNIQISKGAFETISDEDFALLDSYDVSLFSVETVDDASKVENNDLALKANVTALNLKADKEASIATVNAAASVVVAAPIQTAAYVQADVQAIAALANDLKAKYDAAIVLINQLKQTINGMND